MYHYSPLSVIGTAYTRNQGQDNFSIILYASLFRYDGEVGDNQNFPCGNFNFQIIE